MRPGDTRGGIGPGTGGVEFGVKAGGLVPGHAPAVPASRGDDDVRWGGAHADSGHAWAVLGDDDALMGVLGGGLDSGLDVGADVDEDVRVVLLRESGEESEQQGGRKEEARHAGRVEEGKVVGQDWSDHS